MKDLDNLKKRYFNQDNTGTRYPIFVEVQELTFVGVINEEYDAGYDEIKYEHCCEECENKCEDFSWDGSTPEHCDEDIPCAYKWIPIEFFLTAEGADEFIKADGHNHRKLRKYVRCFSRRNFEMNALMEFLGMDNPLDKGKS